MPVSRGTSISVSRATPPQLRPHTRSQSKPLPRHQQLSQPRAALNPHQRQDIFQRRSSRTWEDTEIFTTVALPPPTPTWAGAGAGPGQGRPRGEAGAGADATANPDANQEVATAPGAALAAGQPRIRAGGHGWLVPGSAGHGWGCTVTACYRATTDTRYGDVLRPVRLVPVA